MENEIVARKAFIYYRDVITDKLYITRDILELSRTVDITINGEPQIIENKNCYSISLEQLRDLEAKTNYKGIEKAVEIKRAKKAENTNGEVVIAYRDMETGDTYLPVEYIDGKDAPKRTIMDKDCIKANEKNIEKLKKVITIGVYLKPEKELSITICSLDNQLFIPSDIALIFGINTDDKRKIKVDGNLYIEVSEDDLVNIKRQAEKNNRRIAFDKKSIKPKQNNALNDMLKKEEIANTVGAHK